MNSNETRTLWISVGAALFAIFLLYGWFQEKQAQMSRQFGSSKRVVVAAKDIAELERIDESKLEVIERPVDFIEPEAITDAEAAIGQVAVAPIKKGEQVLQTKLLLPGPETGLAMEIANGKRAVTVPVDDMRGVSRLLRPGDRIDLVAAIDVGKGSDLRREVRTILQDVLILAAGKRITNHIPRRLELDSNGQTVTQVNLSADTTFTNITVEVKPDEAQQLIYLLATSPGNIFAMLRNPNDRYVNPARSTTLDDLLGRSYGLPRLPAAAPILAPPQLPIPAPAAKSAVPAKRKRPGFEEL